MPFTKSSLFTAALLASSAASVQSPGKPTDPQIAHIAYTADEIDIKAGQLALSKSKKTARSPPLPKTWCATTRR